MEPQTQDLPPVGALPQEVADDVPTLLSEGEFVFPANVVRYIGLDRLMAIRDQALAGLGDMADEGQMKQETPTKAATDIDAQMASLGFTPKVPPQQLAIGGLVQPLGGGTRLFSPLQQQMREAMGVDPVSTSGAPKVTSVQGQLDAAQDGQMNGGSDLSNQATPQTPEAQAWSEMTNQGIVDTLNDPVYSGLSQIAVDPTSPFGAMNAMSQMEVDRVAQDEYGYANAAEMQAAINNNNMSQTAVDHAVQSAVSDAEAEAAESGSGTGAEGSATGPSGGSVGGSSANADSDPDNDVSGI